jgi:IS4 transposase
MDDDDVKTLKAQRDAYKARCKALEALLEVYRLGGRLSDTLADRLAKTKAAVAKAEGQEKTND